MEQQSRVRVVGQEDAIQAVANTVRAARAGLGDPNRPIGSFLFLGPTGVGKTETARALAGFLFDDGRLTDARRLLRGESRDGDRFIVGARDGRLDFSRAEERVPAMAGA
jgi:AAA+ superfamily predicted ATPase